MNVMPDFHDGSFDGLWISDKKRIHLFLSTIDKRRFTLVLHEVKRFNASNVKQGNIILDLTLLDTQQLTSAIVKNVYDLVGVQEEGRTDQFLSSAKREGLKALEISSSYGAECTALFGRAECHPDHFCGDETGSGKE